MGKASRSGSVWLWLVGLSTVIGIDLSPRFSNGCGDGERPVAVPRRHDCPKTAGRTAGSHYQQIIGAAQRGMHPRFIAARRDRGLADIAPLAALDSRRFEDVFPHI